MVDYVWLKAEIAKPEYAGLDDIQIATAINAATFNDAQDIREQLEHELAAVIDAGACPLAPTTVIDLTAMGQGGEPVVVRQGRGDVAALGL